MFASMRAQRPFPFRKGESRPRGGGASRPAPEADPPFFPEAEVVEKGLKLHRDLVPITAEVEILLAEFTGPLPHVPEHLLVKPLCPGEGERC